MISSQIYMCRIWNMSGGISLLKCQLVIFWGINLSFKSIIDEYDVNFYEIKPNVHLSVSTFPL